MRRTPALFGLLLGVSAWVTVAPAFAQTCACPPADGFVSGPVIQAEEPPPPLPYYEQPPIPAPGYVWTPGYWAWNNYDYYWTPGVWVAPPQPGLLWTPAYWAFVGGAYVFRQGYWGPHVGFYGGVNYGYGYNGLGYEGGRWEGGRFVYNTTVNNFGGVRITNIYTQPVAPPPGGPRASYNGGPGGVALRPTPEQERLTTEERIRPTAPQLAQARAASMEATQFRSVSQGKPAVGATQRAGDLRGPGAVPARPAGSAEIAPTTGPNGAPLPNGEPRPAPGERAPGAPGPNADHRLPSGSALPAIGGAGGPAAGPGAGERPPAPGPAPQAEKPPRPQPPNGARPDLGPAAAPPRPQGAARPETFQAAPQREAAPEPRPPLARPEGQPPRPEGQPPRPQGQPPRPEGFPGGGPKGPPAAERRPERPEHRDHECRPGEPNCR